MKISYVAQNGVFSTKDVASIRGHFLQQFLSLGHQVEVVAKEQIAPGFPSVQKATSEIALIEGAHPLDPKVKDCLFARKATENSRSVTYIHWDPQIPKPNQPWKILKTWLRESPNSVRIDFAKCLCESVSVPASGVRDQRILVQPRDSYQREQLKLFVESGNFLVHGAYESWMSKIQGLDQLEYEHAQYFTDEDFASLAEKHEFVYLLTNPRSSRLGNIPYEFFIALACGALPLLDSFNQEDAKFLLGPIGPRLCVRSSNLLATRNALENERVALIEVLRTQIVASKPTENTLKKLFWIHRQPARSGLSFGV